MNEFAEGVPIQDSKLNLLVREGIFQPFSARTNPYHDNQLSYFNPDLSYTNPRFDFSKGLPSHLPYMLALGENKRHPDVLVYCRPNNRRTGILTSSSGILSDNIPLNYLDEKGLGQLLEKRTESSPLRREYVHAYSPQAGKLHGKPVTWGITNLEWALHDARSSEDLISDGLRVVPTVAVIQIHKIPDEEGNYVFLEDAVKKGLLAENVTPAIQFRAFVTPYRPNEFIFTEAHKLSEKELKRRRVMFIEAIDDMSKDKSIPIDFGEREKSIPAYLDWFAETFGRTVARLHKARKVHNWLHELHNVTLDVRIIDSDGLELNASDRDIYNEKGSLFSQYPDSPSDLWKYYNSIKNLFQLSVSPDDLMARTIQSYDDEFVK